MARLSKRDRLHQCLRYLVDRFDCPARLRVEKKLPRAYRDCEGCFEITMDSGLPGLIRSRATLSLSSSVSTLLHEFAHALAFSRDSRAFDRKTDTGGHDFLFYRCLREIENDWHYREGSATSRDH